MRLKTAKTNKIIQEEENTECPFSYSSHMVYGKFSPKHTSLTFYGVLMYSICQSQSRWWWWWCFRLVWLKWFVWTNWIENCCYVCTNGIVNLNFDRIKYASTNWWRSQMCYGLWFRLHRIFGQSLSPHKYAIWKSFSHSFNVCCLVDDDVDDDSGSGNNVIGNIRIYFQFHFVFGTTNKCKF